MSGPPPPGFIVSSPPGAPARAGARRPVRPFRELDRSREILRELTLRDLRIRYKQAVMGILWAVLTPLVVALSGWMLRLAFSYMSSVPLQRADLAAVAIKSVAWSFFVGALSFGTQSITANLPLVTKVYFPRVLLPLSTVATQLVDSAIGVVAIAVLLPFLGVTLTPALAWVPLLVALLVLVTTGLVLLAAAANVFYRDVRHVVQLVTSFGIFFTPVFYDAGAFGKAGLWFLHLNPLAPLLEGLRLAVVTGHNLAAPLVSATGVVLWAPRDLLVASASSILVAVIGWRVFRRVEFAFPERV